MPKEVSPREKELLREFRGLRDQRYELGLFMDKHNAEFRQARESFAAKNPGANFVGSSEWEQVMKKERQLAHDYIELEDKIKAVEGKLDALVTPEERKLDNQITKVEDRISDIEEQISEAEDDGRSTNAMEQQKVNLEKQLDLLLAQSQELESKTSPKAEADRIDQALALFEKKNPATSPKPRGKTLDRFVDSVSNQLDQELNRKTAPLTYPAGKREERTRTRSRR